MELMNIASGKMRKATKPGLVISTQCGVSHKVSLLFGLPRWLSGNKSACQHRR